MALLTASASRLGGGVSSAVRAQAAMIEQAGGRASVVALHDAHSEENRPAFGRTPLHTAKVRGPAFFGYAPALVERLIETEADILHLHGIWMYPSRAAAAWSRRTGKPYLISPHGMLDRWITARGRWKKALAKVGYERESWRRASAFHALTHDEAADIRRETGLRRVLVIPNACPLAVTPVRGDRPPHVLYLGRIHPKKNLGALLDGWAIAQLPPEATLTIAGWGDAADEAALKVRLASAPPSIRFIGDVHGEAKQRLFEQARFAVLPSHSEGLPMTMLEAWGTGTPTIMTPACHLPEGFAAGAAIECGTEPASIAIALARGMALAEPAWRAMSEAALTLARGRFSADSVAGAWTGTYLGLAER